MTPGGRLSAAIEILSAIEQEHRPVAVVLKDWGSSHRFAGSRDRAAIASLIYDVQRRRASAAWLMKDDKPRALLIGTLKVARELEPDAISALFDGEAHAPPPLNEQEKEALAASTSELPPHVAGDFPAWLQPALQHTFGPALVDELRAMASRAPVDMRVNTLKSTPETMRRSLSHLAPQDMRFSPIGLRFAVDADGRGPAFAGEPAFIKGQIEVQDEGSQLAVQLARPQPGAQVLDLCAGGGGKTLALAAAMENRGQVYATDRDGRRLAGLFPRLDKSGARNVQIRAPRNGVPPISDLQGRCDLVLVDAPCSGTGTWRRNPDAKWRMRPGSIEQRIIAQDEVLREAAGFVRPGGRLVYVTCSILSEENQNRITAFCTEHAEFTIVDPHQVAKEAGLSQLENFTDPEKVGLQLTPRRTGTDGFFIATLVRNAEV